MPYPPRVHDTAHLWWKAVAIVNSVNGVSHSCAAEEVSASISRAWASPPSTRFSIRSIARLSKQQLGHALQDRGAHRNPKWMKCEPSTGFANLVVNALQQLHNRTTAAAPRELYSPPP